MPRLGAQPKDFHTMKESEVRKGAASGAVLGQEGTTAQTWATDIYVVVLAELHSLCLPHPLHTGPQCAHRRSSQSQQLEHYQQRPHRAVSSPFKSATYVFV